MGGGKRIIYLKRLRKNHDLTQKEISEKLGVSLRTYQRIESGRQKPNCNVIIILQRMFEKKIETIITKDIHIKD